jgi:hypothetical protein
VKVRCTKCKHVFAVEKEVAESEPLQADVAAGSSFDAALAAVVSPPPAEQFSDTALEALPVPSAGTDDVFGTVTLPQESNEPDSGTLSPFDVSAIVFESDELPDDLPENSAETPPEPADMGGDIDFSSFDFGESTPAPAVATPSEEPIEYAAETIRESAPHIPQKESPQGLDFSDDDMFGAVVLAPPEPSSDSISFDFDGDSFAESMDMGGLDSSNKSGAPFSLDAPGDAPFNLGEIDFGDELTSVAVQQVNPEDLKPAQENLFAPLAEARIKSADDDIKQSFLGEEYPGAQQELPPLSITSRRKQSPLFGVLIGLVAVLMVSVLGYLGYSLFSVPKETTSSESGKITVRAVKATFVENNEAGELLVISGETLNEYPKPRAALQVKVTVFDTAGQSIATKNAYSGNLLTVEQLKNLPLDKIEAAMANQFGDSLANMEVAPGKVIPFVAVLANLPKGAKNFGVESAGSTVATGK